MYKLNENRGEKVMGGQINRRDFLKKTAATGLALGVTTFSSKSYSRIIGANERVNFAIIGLHGRGIGHLAGIAECKHAMVSHICDVDQRELDKFSPMVEKSFGQTPVKKKDIRKLLESKDIDVITIATPEHWHTPMAIMGLEAGKHVYVEKPCSHNPAEGELLVKAQKKYDKFVQMGNQKRSSRQIVEAIQKIREGIIGKIYFGKAWYYNNRESIGIGKEVSVPDYLDWELWQGPAPRRPYKDNIHPYNWHWFWHWGTGETLNNGTHEVDVCLWAMDTGLEYPKRISASGGRYHYKDDWEFYDTLVTSFEYEDKMITWEGLSCQGKKRYFNRDRGSLIQGTEGAVLIDESGYVIFDRDTKVVQELKSQEEVDSGDLISVGPLTVLHFQNLINAIKLGEKLHSPVDEGNISVTMLQLSNISWKIGRVLNIDSASGRILGDEEAMEIWSREYEPGWELKI